MGLYNQHVNIQAYYIILSVYMLTILNPEFFSITVVPSVDGDAAKCVSDSDTITNFRYQNLTAVSNLAIWINYQTNYQVLKISEAIVQNFNTTKFQTNSK